MSDNFQDNIVYGQSTLAVSGDAIIVGSTDAGPKSVIFNNSGSQGHLAWQPSGNHTITIPDANGVIQLTGQAPGAIYDGANSITSGTIRFTNANGVSFSINGQTISGSVAAQTNQTVGIYAVSNSTQSSSGTLDARSLSFQGAGIASVGYTNGSVVISVPSGGGAGDGVNIIAAGTQTAATTGTVLFSNRNGVTFGMSNSSIVTASVAAQTNQTVGLYALGNTTQNSSTTLDARTLSFNALGAATMGYSNGSIQISVPSNSLIFSNTNNVSFGAAGSTTITASAWINASAGTTSNNLSNLVLSNSNGVSFGLNGSTITGSVAAQTAQTIGIYATSNTTGASSSSTYDARSLTIQGAGIISVGNSNGSVIISATGGGGGTASLYALGNTTQNSSTALDIRSLSFNGLGAATMGYSNGSIQVSVPNGVVSFSNLNGVTFGSAGATTITASVAAQTNQTVGLYALGNTTQNSSTTLDARTLSFNGLGIVTAGYSNGSIQISATQSNQIISVFGLGNTTQSSSRTIDARSFSLNGLGIITVGMTNGSIQLSATQSAQTQSIVQAIYDGANSISTGTIRFSNSNGVTFGINGQTITASVAGGGGVALSAGTNSTSTGTVVFSNSNNMTFGMDTNGVVTGSFAGNNTASTFVLGISTQGNTSGTTGFANQSVQLVGTNGITISQSINGNSATMTFSGPGNIGTLSQYDPIGYSAINSASTLGQNSLYFVPFDVPNYVSAYRINFFVSVGATVTASNTSGGGGYTQSAAIYARDTGTNSTRITSQWSGSWGISSTVSSNTQINITFPQGINNSTSVSTNSTGITNANATTFIANSISGFRAVPLPISSIMTPGRYWLAVANSASSNASYAITCNVMQISYSNNLDFRPFGTSSAASNASFYAIRDGLGTYSATSGAFPGTVIMNSDTIRAALTAIIPYFNFSGYTTATNMI